MIHNKKIIIIHFAQKNVHSVQGQSSVFHYLMAFNSLSTNPTKWPNTLKQFVGSLPTNCLSVFDHFMNLAVKGLSSSQSHICYSLLDTRSNIFGQNLRYFQSHDTLRLFEV